MHCDAFLLHFVIMQILLSVLAILMIAPIQNLQSRNQAAFVAIFQQPHEDSQPVRVTAMPERDGFDKAALYLNGGLFFVGLVGVGVAFFTLRTISENSKRQLRAYLSVTIGAATPQMRRDKAGGGDLKFDASPNLINNGQTPALKIRFTCRAAILPFPLHKDKHLPEGNDEGMEGNVLGPQQNGTMLGVVDGFCADNEVQRIKDGCHENALYVWGLLTYEDVFGDSHWTRFCQRIWWDMQGNVRGQYVPGRNDAS